MTPRRRLAAERDRMRFSAPRALNEPVFCRFSHLRWISAPAMRLKIELVCSGVRSTWPWMRSDAARRSASDIEAKIDDVAVRDRIFLALESRPTRLLAFGFAAVAHEIVVGDDFGADESLLDVAVDLAGGLLGDGAATDRPRADFVLTGREKADQIEEMVGGSYEAIARR